MKTRTSLFWAVALAAHLLLSGPVGAQGGPVTMTYQGSLSDLANRAVSGTRRMEFRLYPAAEGGEPLWTEVHEEVDVVEGTFTAVLGQTQALPAGLDPGQRLYLGVRVEDTPEFTPRMLVGGALRAQWAAVAAQAEDVRGRHIHPSAVSIGERPVIDEQGRWVGDLAGLQGPAGPQGPVGPQGPAGPPGVGGGGALDLLSDRDVDGYTDWIEVATGADPVDAANTPIDLDADGVADMLRGPAGLNGAPGLRGPAGPAGPAGANGAPGPAGPQGPEGRPGPGLDLQADTDADGFADWLEVALARDPLDPASRPDDLDANGLADALQGAPGVAGPAGPAGPQGPAGVAGPQGLIGPQGLVGPAGPQGVAGPAGLQGADGPAGPVGPQGPAGPAGGFGADVFDGLYDVNMGRIVPGTTVATNEQPIIVPDNNPVGVTGLINFNVAGLSITRLTVDLEVRHADIGQLTITLQSPAGTQVVLHNPARDIGVDLVGNFDRQLTPAVGTMDAFYGENPSGVWRLVLQDQEMGDVGQLVRWQLNVNEGWAGGSFFAANEVRTDGWVVTDTGVEIRLGGDLVFRNTRGEVTARIDGEAYAPQSDDLVVDANGVRVTSYRSVVDVSPFRSFTGGASLTIVERFGGRHVLYYLDSAGVLSPNYPLSIESGPDFSMYYSQPNCLGDFRLGANEPPDAFQGTRYYIDVFGLFGPARTVYAASGPDAIAFAWRSSRSYTNRAFGACSNIAGVGSYNGGYGLGQPLGVVNPPPGPFTYRFP